MGPAARQAFHDGLNCAQAVFSVFAEQYGLPAETAVRLASGLGAGCKSGEICGAATGALLVIGLRDGADKALCGRQAQAFLAAFRQRAGAVRCLDLLGYQVNCPEGQARFAQTPRGQSSCAGYVETAAGILEEMGY